MVTFPVAYLSWRYVEQPFRDKQKFDSSKILLISFSCLSLTILAGLAGHFSGGFPSRHTETPHYQLTQTPALFNDECLERYPEFSSLNTCRSSSFNEPTIALIGDSHSHALYESLAASFAQETVINLGVWSCYPFVNKEHLERNECSDKQALLSSFLQINPQIHTVYLAGYWGYLASGGFAERGAGWRLHDNITDLDADSFLTNAADFLTDLEHHKRMMFLIEDVPDLDFSPLRCGDVGMPRFGDARCSMRFEDYIERKRQVEPLINSLISDFPSVSYVLTQELFCDETVCNAFSNGETLYRNGDHVSKNGADLVIEAVSRVVNERMVRQSKETE